jgi:hypothetical protein
LPTILKAAPAFKLPTAEELEEDGCVHGLVGSREIETISPRLGAGITGGVSRIRVRGSFAKRDVG